MVDGRVESHAHGLCAAAGVTVEEAADASVIGIEADVRENNRFTIATFGGHERAVEGVEILAESGTNVRRLVGDVLEQVIAWCAAEEKWVDAMFYYVAEIDVVAARCDGVEVRVLGEAGVLRLVGEYIGRSCSGACKEIEIYAGLDVSLS